MIRIAAVWVWVAACTGDDPEPVDTDLPLPIWPYPTVAVTEPVAQAVINTTSLRVVVTTADFKLTGKTAVVRVSPGPLWWLGSADAHVLGEEPNGYIVYDVDGRVLAETIETDVLLPIGELTEGQHYLTVKLLYPDGDGFYPPVLAQVPFTFTPAM
jgi:hypothetical protein